MTDSNAFDRTSADNDFTTKVIHAGIEPDPVTGSILPPIYQTTTYAQEAVGVDKGYKYSRTENPTVSVLEKKLGDLENVPPAVCFSTGMAATTTMLLALLRAGDHVVCSDVVYGGTVRVLRQVLHKFGVTATYVSTADPAAVEQAMQDNTRLLFVETPANPTMKLSDIASMAEIAKARGIPLAVDNTFLTPALQRPIDLGADIVLYSTTKYFDGHNATVGGALLSTNEEYLEEFRFVQNSIGSIISPFQAWLTLQGVKTLSLRMAQHSRNALQVAEFLQNHPKVDYVFYPGLTSFAQHELARRQQQDFGGMLCFEVQGGYENGVKFINATNLCTLAENLGSVETLITHPASMTHGPVPPEDRLKAGITDGLVRLSVGIESVDDIIQDLDYALSQIA